MNLTDLDGDRILLAILAEVEAFSTIDDGLFETNHRYVHAVQHIGIPYRPTLWFGGRLSGGRRKAISRAATRLGCRGQLKRITEKHRNRVTHVQPTPTGFKRALDLANGCFDATQLTESLARIEWSDAIWNELDHFLLEQPA